MSFLENKFFVWLVVYLGFMLITNVLLEYNTASYFMESPLNLIANLLLACTTFSGAFSFKSLSSKLLKGNDISYGIYIYHMLVVNILVHHGLLYDFKYVLVVLIIVIFISFVSWKII